MNADEFAALVEQGVLPLRPDERPVPGDLLIMIDPPNTAGWTFMRELPFWFPRQTPPRVWYRICTGEEPWPPQAPYIAARPIRRAE